MKTLILIPFIFIVSICSAQLEKGNLNLGGTTGFSAFFSNGTSFVRINVSPRIGGFISDRLVLGGVSGFNIFAGDGSAYGSYDIGPFVRFYFTKQEEYNGSPFMEAAVLLNGNFSGGFNELGANIGIGFGYAFFLNQGLSLDVIFGYNYLTLPELHIFGINFGFQGFLSKSRE